jgi:LysM repeat protein
MVTNCNKFYYVIKDDTCYDLAAKFSITLDQFYAWNPFVGNTCKKLMPETYVCVGLIGQSTSPSPTPNPSSTVRPTPTITTPTNGIATPTPIQSGMVGNCNKFYFVVKDDNCYAIAQSNSVSLDQFYIWNPAAGSTCATLGLGTYVCVGTTNFAPTTLKTTAKPTTATPCIMTFNLSKGQYECPTATPTPTKAGNGIATPTPFQAGMTTNCKKFYKVVKDDGCWAISNTYGISLDDFYKWNPAVGGSCATLYPDNYVCVGV